MAETSTRTVLSTVKQYGGKLLGFIRGQVRNEEDAEDLLQEVWYQLSKVVNLDEIESISGWLFQVARNKITDSYRKKKEEPLAMYEDEEDDSRIRQVLMAEPQSLEDQFFWDLFWEELMQALEELPEKQRQVFIWNELEDQTLQEIADKTGENLKTIISRKRYAVQHLRKRLDTLYHELNQL